MQTEYTYLWTAILDRAVKDMYRWIEGMEHKQDQHSFDVANLSRLFRSESEEERSFKWICLMIGQSCDDFNKKHRQALAELEIVRETGRPVRIRTAKDKAKERKMKLEEERSAKKKATKEMAAARIIAASRGRDLLKRFNANESMDRLVKRFGVTSGRIYQIIDKEKRKQGRLNRRIPHPQQKPVQLNSK